MKTGWKWAIVLTAVLLMLGASCAMAEETADAYTLTTEDGWEYQIIDMTKVRLCGYQHMQGVRKLEIPDRIADRRIEFIGEGAFAGCTELQEVSIPSGVLYLEAGAFSNCTSLRYVDIPETVKYIEGSVFSNCDGLYVISLPYYLETLGGGAFYDCDNLRCLTVPYGVTEFNSVIYGCDQLKYLYLPGDMTSINFRTIPDSVLILYCPIGSKTHNLTRNVECKIPNITGVAYSYGNVPCWMEGADTLQLNVGETFDVRGYAGLFLDDYGAEYSCISSDPEVASVSGTTVTLNRAGSAVLTVTAETDDRSPAQTIEITVYNPVESFTLPDLYLNAEEYSSVTVEPQDIQPENACPVFEWKEITSSYQWNSTGESCMVFRSSEPITVTATAENGVSRSCQVVFFSDVDEIRMEPFPKKKFPGSIEPQVTVVINGVEYVNQPYMYTLSSSDESVARPGWRDGKIYYGTGTAEITAATAGGKTATQTLTRTKADLSDVEEIQAEAFQGTSVESVYLPYGCRSIGSRAFADCLSLVYIYIPETVTYIADDAFDGSGAFFITAAPGTTGAEYALAHGIALMD